MKRRKGYIFTDRMHSKCGIMATIFGILSLGSIGIAVFLTYSDHGYAKTSYGFAGLFATLFCIAGLVLTVISLQNKRSFRLFPGLGAVFNLLSAGMIGFLIYLGVS